MIRDGAKSTATLEQSRQQASLFRTLATLRTELPLVEDVDELRWNGSMPGFEDTAAELDAALTIRTRNRTPR